MRDTPANRTKAAANLSGLAWRLVVTRAVICWERLWRTFWPVAAAWGIYLAAGLFDIWTVLPYGLHLAAFLALTGFSGWWIWHGRGALHWPAAHAAARRLERENGLANQPLAVLEDRLSLNAADPVARQLWELHVNRNLAAIKRLRLPLPRPRLVDRDRYGLRMLAAIMLVAAGFAAGPDGPGRLSQFVLPLPHVTAAVPLQIEAWVTAPEYTGAPPLFLAGSAANLLVDDGRTPAAHKVPVNSILSVRTYGDGQAPHIVYRADPAGAAIAEKPEREIDLTAVDRRNFAVDLPLPYAGVAELRHGFGQVAQWPFGIIPDTPPEIRFAAEPSVTMQQALDIRFAFADDYGVSAAWAEFTPEGDLSALGDSDPDQSDGALLRLPLSLAAPGQKKGQQQVIEDLTAHPWAGLPVRLRLVARDAAGQTGFSASVPLTLPQRIFENPLARALIEQRRKLFLGTGENPAVITALDALSLFPDLFIDDLRIYIGMRVARYRLAEMRDQRAAAQDVGELLWELALRLEDGDVSLAADELRSLQKALREALSNGAPDTEIAALMSQLREAINRFFQAMVDQAIEDAQEGMSPPMQNPDAEQLETADLQALLDKIEQLGKAGAREAAQNLLNELQSILENMQMSFGGDQGGQDTAYTQALDELADVMRAQQALQDKTYQQSPSGQQGEGTPAPGGSPSLSEQQKALRGQLDTLMRQLGAAQGEVPKPLERAGKAMEDAAAALGSGERKAALDQQVEAMEQLRDGAEAIARAIAEEREGGEGEFSDSEDPLGRQLPAGQRERGGQDAVPEEFDVERALELRQELERRAGERRRPVEELDYIDRLLDLF